MLCVGPFSWSLPSLSQLVTLKHYLYRNILVIIKHERKKAKLTGDKVTRLRLGVQKLVQVGDMAPKP